VLFGYVGVKDAELSDHEAVFIREKGIADAMPLGELKEDVLRVVADGEDLDAVTTERFLVALQLDELRLAEASPGRASVKHDQCAVGVSGLAETDQIAELVRQGEVG
jgi:hypothetical protein